MRAVGVVVMALSCVLVTGCGGEPLADEDGGVLRGPEGGVLRFDAAMIVADAGPPPADVPFVRADTPVRDSGTRRCSGIARDCRSFGSSFTCASQDGCRRDGECRGVASSCYTRFSSFTCTSQDGCFWSSSRDECSGSPRSCSGYFDSFGCTGQEGCYWQDTCSGVAASCFGISASLCELQEGCYLE